MCNLLSFFPTTHPYTNTRSFLPPSLLPTSVWPWVATSHPKPLFPSAGDEAAILEGLWGCFNPKVVRFRSYLLKKNACDPVKSEHLGMGYSFYSEVFFNGTSITWTFFIHKMKTLEKTPWSFLQSQLIPPQVFEIKETPKLYPLRFFRGLICAFSDSVLFLYTCIFKENV